MLINFKYLIRLETYYMKTQKFIKKIQIVHIYKYKEITTVNNLVFIFNL